MTIVYKKNSSLFDDNSDLLVNPVNTVGVMGKGLAKAFKDKYPSNFKVYKEYCDKKLLKAGNQLLFIDGSIMISNVATKNHWRDHSKIEDVESCILKLATLITNYKIRSISIPALGCGLGGLNWNDVKPLMEKYLSHLNCHIIIHEPN